MKKIILAIMLLWIGCASLSAQKWYQVGFKIGTSFPLNRNYSVAGDRLSTDKKLAENAGIDFICVLSGECTAEAVAREAIAPTVLVEHLGLALP